jgi:hypothetical protein
MKRLALTIEEERARRTLDLFKRLRDQSDLEIAKAAGWSSHQSVQQRRYGYTRIHPWRDVPRLATALRVDPDCFRMDDHELLSWIEKNAPDLLLASTGWLVAA